MRKFVHGFRRTATLAVLLTLLAGEPVARADTSPATSQGPDPTTQSLLGKLTCGFANTLARIDPTFGGSAWMICHYIYQNDI